MQNKNRFLKVLAAIITVLFVTINAAEYVQNRQQPYNANDIYTCIRPAQVEVYPLGGLVADYVKFRAPQDAKIDIAIGKGGIGGNMYPQAPFIGWHNGYDGNLGGQTLVKVTGMDNFTIDNIIANGAIGGGEYLKRGNWD
ncbi:MAG: hypothetical protein LBH98_05415 [Chitinispirillales bacterium]|jgi:hypothetical protein|nr:hypothetical protein [Chitinispirillales bacterium]